MRARQANEEKAPRLEKSRSDLTGRDANNILTCTKTYRTQARICMFAVMRDESAERPSDDPKGAAWLLTPAKREIQKEVTL